MNKKLDALGCSINYKKSSLVTKKLVFFGLIIDTVSLKSFWEEKVEKIVTLGNIILRKREITVRTLASFIGLVILVNCITEI